MELLQNKWIFLVAIEFLVVIILFGMILKTLSQKRK